MFRDPIRPSCDEIRKLADYYELTGPWPRNPHLRFKTGDGSYWCEEQKNSGLTAKDLSREFESRRIVLARAEKENSTIASPGDLSHEAELLQGQMLAGGK